MHLNPLRLEIKISTFSSETYNLFELILSKRYPYSLKYNRRIRQPIQLNANRINWNWFGSLCAKLMGDVNF